MEKLERVNIGIDMSKITFWASITVKTLNNEVKCLSSKEFCNTDKRFATFLKWVKSFLTEEVEISFTMEATGVYYECLAMYLFDNNFIVHVVLPIKAKYFIKSLDIKSKTDKMDSKALGQLGLERKLRAWQPISPIYKEIKSLTRERNGIIKFRTKQKNNLHALLCSYKPNKDRALRTQATITFLDGQIKEVEKQIKNVIKSDEALNAKVENIKTIPGVGDMTAAVVISETNGFAFIENAKQLCSFAGLDVKLVESGNWKGKSKISKQGNSHIRAILYFPSLTAIRSNSQHEFFYKRILAEKKKSKIAITAVQRKLLILIYSIWKSNQQFQIINQFKNVA